jgi:recombination protein RecA
VLKDGDQIYGNRTKVKIVKNKVASPFKECEVDMIHGEGISFESDVLDLGAANAVVEKSGSWFSYKGERIGQGRDNARKYLKEHPEMAQQIAGEIRSALTMPVPSKSAAQEAKQATLATA